MRAIPRASVILSAVAALGAASASLATLTWSGAFPEAPGLVGSNQILAEARGWSIATLVLALPTLLAAMRAAVRGSLKGRLVWLGGLTYLVYTYLEFAVGPPFTLLFLVYVITFSTALLALIGLLTSLDFEKVAAQFSDAPRRSAAAFALLVGCGLALAWLKSIVSALASGPAAWPQGEAAVRHVVYALDLGLQVPLLLAAGILLLLRRNGGYPTAGIMLVNAVLMSAALTLMVVMAQLGPSGSLTAAVPFAILFLFALSTCLAFFGVTGHLGRGRRHGTLSTMAKS